MAGHGPCCIALGVCWVTASKCRKYET